MVAPPIIRVNEYNTFTTQYDREYQLKGRQTQLNPAPVPEMRHPWKHTLVPDKRVMNNVAERQRVNAFKQRTPERLTEDALKQIAVMTIKKRVGRPAGGGFTSQVPLFKDGRFDDGTGPGAGALKPNRTHPGQFAATDPRQFGFQGTGSGALTNNRTTDVIGDGEDCRWEKPAAKAKQKPVCFKEEKNKYQIGGENWLATGGPQANYSRWRVKRLKRTDPIRHDVELGVGDMKTMYQVAHERTRPSTDKLVADAVRQKGKRSRIMHTAFSRMDGVGFDPDYAEPVLNPTQYKGKVVRQPIARRLETEGQQRSTITLSQHIAQHKYGATPAVPREQHLVKAPPYCRDGPSTETAEQPPHTTFDFPSPSATFADRLRSTVRGSARDDEFDY